jgi:hypothetical protein
MAVYMGFEVVKETQGQFLSVLFGFHFPNIIL